jgi:WD40 repeat protein
VQIWNGEGKTITSIVAESGVLAIDYDPSSQRVAIAGLDKQATIWSPFTQSAPLKLSNQPSSITACRWLDEKYLLVGDSNGQVWLWNVDTCIAEKRWRAHEQQVSQIAMGSDWYATGSWDGVVHIWSKRHRERTAFEREGKPVTSLAVEKETDRLFVCYWDGGIRVWDPSKSKLIDEFSSGEHPLTASCVSSDGLSLVTGDQSGALKAWSLASMGVIQYLHRHCGEVYDVTYTPDNANVLSVGWDGMLRVWDRETHSEIGYLAVHEVPASSVAASPDNSIWAIGARDGSVKFWDVAQQSFETILQVHKLAVSCIRLGPLGDTAYLGSWDNRLTQCAVRGQFVDRTFDGHSKEVSSCDLSLDLRRLVSGSWDGSLRIWNLEDEGEYGRASLVLSGHTGHVYDCAFSPDGRTVASAASDGSVRVWSAERLEEPHILEGHMDEVTSVNFTPDGSIIISADRSGMLYFWNAHSLEPIGTLLHDVPILCMAISPDGLQAVIGDSDGNIRFLDLEFDIGPIWMPTSIEYKAPPLWRYGSPPIEGYQASCLYCGTSESLTKDALGKAWRCPSCKAELMLCPRPKKPGARVPV